MSFRGLLYVLGHFQQKKNFFQKFFSRQFTLFICGFTYKQKASLGLGPQSKDWEKRLRLGPLVPTGLTQDRGPESVFRKGLRVGFFLLKGKPSRISRKSLPTV